MTELEILAELKRSFEYIEDILDNADNTQIGDCKNLAKVLDILEEKYEEVYNNIKETEKERLYYKDKIMIGEQIYYDYQIDDINCGDFYLCRGNIEEEPWFEKHWWENYIYLMMY